MNPNLAAGSAASAGSVVSRSNTDSGFDSSAIGKALDAYAAINSLREQNVRIENAKTEGDNFKLTSKILANQLAMSDYDEQRAAIEYSLFSEQIPAIKNMQNTSLWNQWVNNQYDTYQKMLDLGFDPKLTMNEFTIPDSPNHMWAIPEDAPLRIRSALNTKMLQNNAAILQNDANWNNVNHIMNAIRQGTGAISDIGGLFFKGLGAFNSSRNTDLRAQQNDYFMRPMNSYTTYGNGYSRTQTWR